ncbi:type II toxin-antitoxin system HigB family toxin [Leptolyngbya sp. FACHB-321]|uniref:type II toxin-antitoxin system HigB family toxin n=1 Tax=Leptolyngbya sp. FACHB-321 TaxID=2692807 RepID=UPI0016873EC2|nr:type II toxin-antitoxin system HigB family toxin [Leptolyngbya sp. FACHB-321]MBD2035083.1 type II toxin-antitoxin system HigB family toxin [Leptolyngbya sp. FACHB-321]
MHVIRYKQFRDFGKKHSDNCGVLDDWLKVASRANWSNLSGIQSVFPQAEVINHFTVFSLKGKQYRLIVSINYEGQLIYLKHLLTHAEYKEQQQNGSYF